ncbi:hypothetical protein DSUL_50452 [Desulfovibrionales bacterium]
MQPGWFRTTCCGLTAAWVILLFSESVATQDMLLSVQVASFKNQVNAQNFFKKILAKGYHKIRIVQEQTEDQQIYKVQIGPFPTMDEAKTTLNQVTKDFLKSYIVTDSESAITVPRFKTLALTPEYDAPTPLPARNESQEPPANLSPETKMNKSITEKTPQEMQAFALLNSPVVQTPFPWPILATSSSGTSLAVQPETEILFQTGVHQHKARLTGYYFSENIILLYAEDEEFMAWDILRSLELNHLRSYLYEAKRRSIEVTIFYRYNYKDGLDYKVFTQLSSRELGVIDIYQPEIATPAAPTLQYISPPATLGPSLFQQPLPR